MPINLTGTVAVPRPLGQPGASHGVSGLTGGRSPKEGPTFAETLKGYLQEVTSLEREAEQKVQGLAEGKTTDVHQVMLAVEEANLALDLLIQIRNRLMDAYKELSSTSV